ncbi:MAG: NUDIX hydrolase [Candidatus Bathyarchaeota archaeon]|nr:NUDIX hydrolase [Candidatus Bathyarchaeota archaeon]
MSHRLYPQRPIVGVGVLIEQEGEYLLIKRAAEPDKGLWSIPGGLVEVGEKASEAAAREALEETGLTVKIVKRISVIDKIVKDEKGKIKFHFIIIDFLANPLSGEVHAMDDALEAKWVKPENFIDYNMSPTLLPMLKEMGLYPG